MKINPHFRTIDEVEKPAGDNLYGWTDGKVSEQEALEIEARALDRFEADSPVVFRSGPPAKPNPVMQGKWEAFQEERGRFPGSADWTLFDEFSVGKALIWKPQIIGSCVWSNTFRAHVIRCGYQLLILGDADTYFGRNEFGPDNFAVYGPWSYGMARRRANMRRGDGLYCEPMAESLVKDGVLLCSTPKLQEICGRLGVDRPEDFPEPQSASVYRDFGRWQYLDELAPYAGYPVKETIRVRSAEQLWELLGECKTAFVCSGEAIHKVGEHPDGFPIHARNPRDSWAHNMAFHGRLVASDGERFFRESNESWGMKHVYNRRFAEVAESFDRGRLTVMAIGEVELPRADPPAISV